MFDSQGPRSSVKDHMFKDPTDLGAYSPPNRIAMWLYWMGSTILSLTCIASFSVFLQYNIQNVDQDPVAFGLCAAWLGLRLVNAMIQIPLHSIGFNSLRFRETSSVCHQGALHFAFCTVLPTICRGPGPSSWDNWIPKCTKYIILCIALGIAFCVGCGLSGQSESGLDGTQCVVALEAVNVMAWVYVLLYRQVYDAETRRRSWGFVQALEKESG